MTLASLETASWSQRRRRAAELAERWGFADEVLAFYTALLPVQEAIYEPALERKVAPGDVAAFAAEHAMPRVIEVSVTNGPAALMGSVLERFHETDTTELVQCWLDGGELSAVETFLARAATGPILEALGQAAGDACKGPRDERHCPVCGGLPQVSYLASSPEDLVTAHRYLECSRCAASWSFGRLMCPACGENDASHLSVYSELGSSQAELSGGNVVKPGSSQSGSLPAPGLNFPHVRIDACQTCKQYLLNVDRVRDGRAVPVVDEMAALPLDLYAKELGMSKIVPNLMGF
jgi:formate dehydrogenase maturation protein FdhE